MQSLKVTSPYLSTEILLLNISNTTITPKQLAEIYIDKISLSSGVRISSIVGLITEKELDLNEPLNVQDIDKLGGVIINFERSAGGILQGYKIQRSDQKNLYNLTIVFGLAGDRLPINLISSNWTVRELIQSLAKGHKIPTDVDLVRFSTYQRLEHDKTLDDCEIGDGEILILDVPQLTSKIIRQTQFIDNVDEELARGELIAQDTMRFYFPAPNLLTVREYLDLVREKIRALEFVYYLLAIMTSKNASAIDFPRFLRKHEDLDSVTSQDLRNYANLKPLEIIASHYGSPVTFDILGVGTALELLKDILKDLSWRGKHEENMAKLDLKSKEFEYNKSRLDMEKTVLDLKMRRVELEQASLAVLEKKMELIEKASHLPMSDEYKMQVVAVLAPKLIVMIDNQ